MEKNCTTLQHIDYNKTLLLCVCVCVCCALFDNNKCIIIPYTKKKEVCPIYLVSHYENKQSIKCIFLKNKNK